MFRWTTRLEKAPLLPAGHRLHKGAPWLIVCDGQGVGRGLAEVFKAKGYQAILATLSPNGGQNDLGTEDFGRFQADLSRCLGNVSPLGGVINLEPLSRRKSFLDTTASERQIGIQRALLGTFFLAKHLLTDPTCKDHRIPLWAATVRGGDFGQMGLVSSCAIAGGVGGILKSLQREHPRNDYRVIDFDPQEDRENIILKLWDELQSAASPVEVGYHAGERITPKPEKCSLPQKDNGFSLDAKDLVLVTGGARGITGAIVRALAEEWQTRFVLVGRSDPDLGEWEAVTKGLPEKELKGAIFPHLQKKGVAATPREVEKIAGRVVAAREIKGLVATIETLGSKVFYTPLDVGDERACASAIPSIIAQHGPITAFIHGAGVLQDKLAADKTADQFAQVLDTKIAGFANIFRHLSAHSLKLVSLFTSVAGKYGNRGQTDYAAANEVLNHIALFEAHRFPLCRWLAVNWGPWEGGMVTPALSKMFKEQGVALIPIAGGCRMFVDELRFGSLADREIVIAGDSMELGHVETLVSPGGKGQPVKIRVSVKENPYLLDHKLKNAPVLPVVSVIELLSEFCHDTYPGQKMVGLRDLKVIKGISFEEDSVEFTCKVTEKGQDGPFAYSAITLESLFKTAQRMIPNYSALLERATEFPPVPTLAIPEPAKNPFPHDLDEVYRRYLFHGPRLRAIKSIRGYSKEGISAVLKCSTPADWQTKPRHRRWFTDPLVLDGMAQMGLVWLGQMTGAIGIPIHFDSYHQFTPFPEDEVICIGQVRELNERSFFLTMDAFFMDQKHQVIAIGRGWKSAFHPHFNSYTTGAKA